ncbi:MAG: hypothetical protein RLZZ230_28 [Candidatus Parcubacteria bacterium]|jgi:membrane peptidoglycan carboxypeptidase
MKLQHRYIIISRKYKFITIVLFGFIALLVTSHFLYTDALQRYQNQMPVIIYDRHQIPINLTENSKGHYLYPLNTLPEDFKKLLIAKEDAYFYYHFGINPVSTVRAIFYYLKDGRSYGASTITQQLAKNILGTESDRTFTNKLTEVIYAISLELFTSKEELLLMYANTAYLGNQVQGFESASLAYFGKSLKDTSHSEKVSLLATLSYPSTRNPWEKDNEQIANFLNQKFSPAETFIKPDTTKKYNFSKNTYFELNTAGVNCEETCITTVDSSVTEDIREILSKHIEKGWSNKIKNGAVVIINPHTSEVIALVGTRNPQSIQDGNQINMAISPRPIGSTVKPFIYAKGFTDGLRPYTIVEDREYKYPIASGFSLYPKNYDGQYRGAITLHEALSNSLNVPSVKTLEYIGLEKFYAFLSGPLAFEPIQDYDSYQYGIALGGLEMDLLTLTHYFTIFPNKGVIAPLRILTDSANNFDLPPQSHITDVTRVVEEPYIELVHAIISDRFTGVNQFGLVSSLSLPITGYGVKTGTSRDFHDSWVVGYTSDFVVGVWMGNSENKPLDQVSGQTGAGAVWHEVMEYMINTPYYHGNNLSLDHLSRFNINRNEEWGLPADIVSEHQSLLTTDNLIISIHQGDVFALTENTTIPLKARKIVTWTVNGQSLAEGTETIFHPTETGNYEIEAIDVLGEKRERLTITITTQ